MEIKKDRSIGVIVFFVENNVPLFLIIKHRQGHWSFPKGHKETGETDLLTAKRELKEETGIKAAKFYTERIELSEKYFFNSGNSHRVEKSVDYYVAEVFSKEVNIDNMEILKYEWCDLKSGMELVTFPESQNILNKANEIISNYNTNENFKNC